jgi:uncharacterized protein
MTFTPSCSCLRICNCCGSSPLRIATAAIVGAIGVALLKALKARTLFGSRPIAFKGKPYIASLIPGSLLFGMGWGLAGACPGTALVMLGEGKLGALFTVAGILLGTYLHGLQQNKSLHSSPKQNAAEGTMASKIS